MAAHLATGVAHAFYFVGNCQLQFFAHHLAKGLAAATFCLGRVQIPSDGRSQPIAELGDLADHARAGRAEGKTTTLVLQESLIGKGTQDIGEEHLDSFDSVIRVPIVHFRSVWPDFHLARDFTPTARTVRRMFDREQEKVEETVDRCESDGFDQAAFWDLALNEPVFFHPGHANETVHTHLYDAFMARSIARIAGEEASQTVRSSVAASRGLPLTSLHPIDLAWGDAVGTKWHRHPAYVRWASYSDDDLNSRVSKAIALDIGKAFGRTMKALCADSLSRRHLAKGEHKAGARLAAVAAINLPVTWQIVGNAVSANASLGDTETVRRCLRAIRPSLEPGSAIADNLADWLTRHPQYAPDLPELAAASA